MFTGQGSERDKQRAEMINAMNGNAQQEDAEASTPPLSYEQID